MTPKEIYTWANKMEVQVKIVSTEIDILKNSYKLLSDDLRREKQRFHFPEFGFGVFVGAISTGFIVSAIITLHI